MKKIVISAFSVLGFAVPSIVKAHCPLCTVGAVAIGIGAYKLGIRTESVGIGIGAFAVALGLWIARVMSRAYVPFQRELIVLASFASTIVPVIPFMRSAFPVYISFLGDYGTTVAVNRFLAGSIIGGLLVMIAPEASRELTRFRRNRHIPFQGMIVTFSFLMIAIAIIELL